MATRLPSTPDLLSPPAVLLSQITGQTPDRVDPASLRDTRSVRTSDNAATPFSRGGLQVIRGQLSSASQEVMRLPFSRNPTTYQGELEANIPEAVIPGAWDVSLQHLGAKGEAFQIEVLFHNAFIGANAVPAHVALSWLRTVMRLPGQYKVWWHLGSDKAPVPVALLAIQYEASLFTPPELPEDQTRLPKFLGATPPPDAPQRVTASLKMRRAEPAATLINPFNVPREPEVARRRGGGKRSSSAQAGGATEGADLDAVADALFGSDSLLAGVARGLYAESVDPFSDANVARRTAQQLGLTPVDRADLERLRAAHRSELELFDQNHVGQRLDYQANIFALSERAANRAKYVEALAALNEQRRAVEVRQRDAEAEFLRGLRVRNESAVYEAMLTDARVRTSIRAADARASVPVARHQAPITE